MRKIFANRSEMKVFRSASVDNSGAIYQAAPNNGNYVAPLATLMNVADQGFRQGIPHSTYHIRVEVGGEAFVYAPEAGCWIGHDGEEVQIVEM
jgi:hypothetical protein